MKSEIIELRRQIVELNKVVIHQGQVIQTLLPYTAIVNVLVSLLSEQEKRNLLSRVQLINPTPDSSLADGQCQSPLDRAEQIISALLQAGAGEPDASKKFQVIPGGKEDT